MNPPSLRLVVAAIALGLLAADAIEEPERWGLSASRSQDLFRRGACRDAFPAGDHHQHASVVVFGTSRLWSALVEDSTHMPICARAPIVDATQEVRADLHATVGLRDIGVLYDDVDPLEPETLIVALELFASTRSPTKLADHRESLAAQTLWWLEDRLLPPREAWIRRWREPPCDACWSPESIEEEAKRMRRNIAANAQLRPEHEELLRARAAAGKRTIVVDLPRAESLETALSEHVAPWRALFRERASTDRWLEVWTFPNTLDDGLHNDPGHVNDRGRELVRAWFSAQLDGLQTALPEGDER